MRLLELLLGRPLRSDEETVERIGVLTAIPVLGLAALASASYGPEAALTVLIPLGPAAPVWVRPIALAIVGLLLRVGVWKSIAAQGHPAPVVAPPHLPPSVTAASLWLLLRTF